MTKDKELRSQITFDRRRAANYVGISLISIDRALKEGTISHYRIGRRILFSEDHLQSFLAANERRKNA